MPTTIAQLQAVITADVSQLSQGMAQAQQQIAATKAKGDELQQKTESLKQSASSLGSAFTNLGATLTAALTAPITAMAAMGVSFIDLKQRSMLAFQTMTGSAQQAKAMFSQLQQFAIHTPFDLPSLTRGAQKLLAFGTDAKNVIPTLRVLGDATAAVGGTSATMDEMVAVLGKMGSAATVSSHRINELVAAGLPAWQILAKQMGMTVDQVRSQIESGAVSGQKAVEMLLKGMDSRFGGLMGKMGDTWATTLTNLKDSAAQSLGTLFEPAIESATKFLQNVSEDLFKAKAVFEQMPSGVKTIIAVLLGVAAAAGPVLLAVGGLVKAFMAVSGVIEVVGGLLTAEIVVPIAVVAAAVAAFVLAYRANFLGIRDITNAVLKFVGGLIIDVVAVFIAFGKDLFSILQQVGQALLDWNKKFLAWVHTNSIIQEVASLWSKAWTWISSEVHTHGAEILKVINTIVGAIPGVGMAVVALEDMVGNVAAKDGGFGQQVANERSGLDAMLSKMQGAVSGAAGAFKMPGLPSFGKGSGAPKADEGDSKGAKQGDQFVSEMQKQQLILRLLRQGETKDLADLTAQYATISRARVVELSNVNDQIKGIEDEREKRKSLAESIKSSYASVRDAVLKARDGSEQNKVAVDTYHQAYASLTAAQKQAIAPVIALTVEQTRLNAAHEAAKQAAEDAKKAAEEQAKIQTDAFAAMDKARLAMIASAGATDTEKVAISQFGKELWTLSPILQFAAQQIANWNRQAADNDAITARQKEIAKLTAEYRDAIAGASDFDRFLTEKGVDKSKTSPAQMQSLGNLFDATQLKDQGKNLDQMRSALQKVAAEYLHVSGATEESRLAMQYFGRDIDTLAPDVQAQIRKMAPDVTALEKYKQYREAVKQVGEEIKSVFESAFESVLTKSGNFFENLIKGFRQMLIKIVAEWAANKVAQALIGLWDKGHQGLADDAAKAAKNMVTGAAAIGIAAAALDKAAKDTKDAATSMATGAGTSLLGGTGSSAMSLMGMGGSGGAGLGSLLGGGIGKFLPYLGIAEGADQLLFHGAITKGIGHALGGIGNGLKKLFHFSSGAWSVPGIGDHDSVPAMLTPGEMVVPKKAAQGIRDGGGWMSGDTHIGQHGTVIINDRADAARIAAVTRAKRQQKLRLA